MQKSGKVMKSRSGGGGGSTVKVIDMTGPQQRVLSSYEEIHDHHSRPDEGQPQQGEQKLLHLYTPCNIMLAPRVGFLVPIEDRVYLATVCK